MTTPNTYPAQLAVACELCPTQLAADFVVTDDMTKAARLNLITDHAIMAGWMCVDDWTYCPTCAGQPTSWTITVGNVLDLCEVIDPSKPHYGAGSTGPSLKDGVTIRAHGTRPRTVARFGDTITRQADGTYTVQPAA
ncbi:hypothetical protein ACFVYP_06900 [Kitasatospora sp. NPDC058201]|uniref:hypothetical protein n=1 Tax=unclassified Kitasatospora TaxID=2633591 RepID=UPI00365DE9A3